MRIFEATPEQVGLCDRLAREYTSIIPGLEYDSAHYLGQLTRFVSSGTGVIFYLESDARKVIGGICGIKYPNLLTGKLTAVELFWYVDKNERGGSGGIRLLDAFEKWAKDNRCARIAMIYLPCSMPEKLRGYYERRGYTLVETHFEKEIRP